MPGDRTINTGGGTYIERLSGTYIQGHYYAKGESKNLAVAAAEIQALLQQLESTYPNSGQRLIAEKAVRHIENNPKLQQRVINAVKEGGLAAFEKAIDNPTGAFLTGAIKGWQDVETD